MPGKIFFRCGDEIDNPQFAATLFNGTINDLFFESKAAVFHGISPCVAWSVRDLERSPRLQATAGFRARPGLWRSQRIDRCDPAAHANHEMPGQFLKDWVKFFASLHRPRGGKQCSLRDQVRGQVASLDRWHLLLRRSQW